MVSLTKKIQSINFFALLLMLVFTLYSNISWAANITVSTSANPVSLDDSFHLIYEADSSVDDDPDFDPISKHFDILSSSQSTSMRLVNGTYGLKKKWDIALIAKDIGDFTIPSISFGADKSPAIRITITNSVTPNSSLPNGQASIPAKLFVESSVNVKQAHVQQEIVLSIRLLRTVSIIGASLSEPTTSDADAIIQRLGEDNRYQTTRNGIRYNVFERRYVIYPQHSGKLTINPVTFEGRVNANQPRTIFDQFRITGQLKRSRTKAITLNILAKPANITTQDWLPARQLQLVEDWSGDITKAKTGEPVTRTITIVAKGLSAVQLPDLHFDDIAGIKQYPDKPITTDKPGNDGITSAKQIKIALIPARAGKYVLPEIKLPWWNTKTHKVETATIPATTLSVSGAVAQSPQVKRPIPTAAETVNDTTNKTPTPPPLTVTNNEQPWKWLSIALAVGWLLTIIYMLFVASKKQSLPVNVSQHTMQSLGSVEKLVLQACKVARKQGKQMNIEQLENIKKALLDWAQVRWPNQHITSLTQLASYCSSELAQALQQLNQVLYNHDSNQAENLSHNVEALSTAFKTFKSDKNTTAINENSPLEPLYKT